MIIGPYDKVPEYRFTNTWMYARIWEYIRYYGGATKDIATLRIFAERANQQILIRQLTITTSVQDEERADALIADLLSEPKTLAFRETFAMYLMRVPGPGFLDVDLMLRAFNAILCKSDDEVQESVGLKMIQGL